MKTKKLVQILFAMLFLIALILNVSLNPLSMMSDKAIAQTTSTSSTTTSTSTNLICTASVDCDLVTGQSYVKCYNYNPNGTCESYPLLHKVICDGRESKCTNF